MNKQAQVNELRRTITWIKRAIESLDQGRIDLAMKMLEDKIKDLDSRRLDISIKISMDKREGGTKRTRKSEKRTDIHRDRHG